MEMEVDVVGSVLNLEDGSSKMRIGLSFVLIPPFSCDIRSETHYFR